MATRRKASFLSVCFFIIPTLIALRGSALQAAQLALLKDPRYDHPCYWAPFLLINNWL